MDTKTLTKEVKSLQESVTVLKESYQELIDLNKSIMDRLDKMPKPRDRGPSSTRTMTDDDARAVMFGGRLHGLSHKDAAKELGLSYGQVYSARGGYTFQVIHDDAEKLKKEAEAAEAEEKLKS